MIKGHHALFGLFICLKVHLFDVGHFFRKLCTIISNNRI